LSAGSGSGPPKQDEEEWAARKGDGGVSVAGRQWHDIRLPPTWESNSAQIGLGTGQGASSRASAGGAVEELEVSGHGPSVGGALLAMDKVDCRESAGGERTSI
jgi:hypothetical protein